LRNFANREAGKHVDWKSALRYNQRRFTSFFEALGKVSHIELLTDKGGRCKGFAFVTMADRKQLEQVIQTLDNTEFKGRVLSVTLANTLPESKPVGFLTKLFRVGSAL
jgi:RNA recognition motif-containing protein